MSPRMFFAAVAVLSVIVSIALYAILPVSAQANNAPVFTDRESTTRSVNENTSSFDNIGARVAATDADNDRLVYTLENARTSPFTIVRATGQLRVGQPLDYEAKSSYTVKVIVTDPEGATDTITVTINVNNVEEAGSVSMSWTRPQAGTAITATLTDPDGSISGTTWQWASSSSQHGTYANLSGNGANTATYTPTAGDVGNYLKVTASYDDGKGSGKSANAVSSEQTRAAPGNNQAPAFRDVPSGTGYSCSGNPTDKVCRHIPRNTPAGEDVYYPVKATDPDSDEIRYSLGGTDKDLFRIDPVSGTLFTTKAHAFSDKGSYSITITAKDPSDGSDSITVTLTPSGSDDTPVVKGPDFIRYTENGTWPLATYSASISGRGGINRDIGWLISVEVGGGDGDFFDIDDAGNLTFTQPPDYENPADGDRDNRYEFHLDAYDSNPPGGRSGETFFSVTVIVEDSTVEPLEIEGPTSVRYPENSTDTVAAYALQGTGASHTWHLSGRDAGEFTLSSNGVLTFNSPPDYENPMDTAGENAYLLTISADTADDSKTEFVRVTVTDVNEPPEFDEGETATREVEHDAELNDIVGDPVTATDPDDGDYLTYSLSDAATLPFAISEYTGQLSLSGALDTNRSSYTVTVLVADSKDDNGDYDINDVDDRITVTINIDGPSNSAPEFPSTETGTRSFPENTTGVQSVGVPVAATDADTGDTLTYSLGGADAGSFTIVSTSGQIQTKTGQTYDYEAKSSYSVTVTATDTANASATQNVTITLTNVDEPGIVTLSTYQPPARAQITATLTDPDGSITGTTWQWAKSSDGNTGWTSVGIYSNTYTPLDGDIGSFLRATASYTDGHGSGKTAHATTTQAVGAGSNRAPDFDETTTSRSFPENAAVGHNIGSPVTATDDDRDTLTYTLEGTDKDSFQIVSTSGQIQTKSGVTYDHETKPSYSVTVKADDKKGGTDTIDVTITVTDANEAPVVSGDTTVNHPENDGGTVATYTATDQDGPPTTFTWTLSGDDAEDFSITGGALTFDPAPNYEAAADKDTNNVYLVTVEASDGTSKGTRDVTVTVTNVNEPPEFDSNTATRSIAENTAAGQNIGAPVAATDPDTGDTLVYALGGADANSFDIDTSTGQLKTKAALNKEAKATYEVTVSVRDSKDSSGNADTATDDTITVTITVTDVNEPPEFNDGDSTARRVSEAATAGQDIGAPVAATDPDAGATLTYTLGGTDAASFAIVATSGQLQTRAALDKETEDTYSVTVSVRDSKDSSGVADTATDDTIAVTITVTDANDAPVVSGDTTLNHPENDSGTVATYTATDQDGPPTTFTWTLSGDDAEDFSITGGALTFDPAPNYEAAADKDTNNVYLVTVEASDGTSKGTRDVTVTVADVDEDGEITFSSIQPQAGTGLAATLADDDIVQSIQSWQWEISGSNNTWTTITGAATGTYVPIDGDVGKYLRVTATYTDGHGSGKTATATTTNMVEEEPTSNEGPLFSTDTAQRSIAENTAAGQNIGAPVAATDPESDTLTYSLSGTDAASFAIVVTSGQLQTKADLDYEIKNSYTVTVTGADPSLDSDTITVTITVTDVNEPPEFNDGDSTARRVSEAATAGQDIGAPVAATDPDTGATLTYTLGGTDAASFAIVATSGQLQTRAALDKETEDTYSVTVSVTDSKDSSGVADTATDDTITVTITVTDANDAPVVSGDTTVNHPENDSGTVATYTATDQDGTTSFTWTLSGDDAEDFSITGGALTFDPAPNYEDAADKDTNNVYLVTVEASDGTAKGTLNVTVTVTDVNEPPEFDDGDQTARRVSEAATAGQNIGAPVAATDPERDTLTYSLGGTDAASFAIVATSGQLQTRAALDKETKDTYTVTVSVRDSRDSSSNADTTTDDTITVTITVTGTNGPPVISSSPRSDSNTPITYPENGRETVARHSYHDPENDSVTWLLLGTDSGDFSISSAGDLTFRSAPDYESPADSNKNNEYRVTVNANDGNGGSDSTHVTVNVTNVEETGTVTLSPTQALIGAQLTATLADPDGSVTSFTWSWEISSGKSSWNSISGATSATYTPVAGDLGKHLRAKVSYTDGHGSGKTAYSAPTGAVRMSNRPPAFPGSGSGKPQTRTVAENTPAGRSIGTPVAATDPDTSAGDSLTYTLGGGDAASFAVVATSGQLQTRATLDYETRRSYTVTVTATDLSNASDSITVNIQVADVDEAGTVALSSAWPRTGAALTAALSDPDAPVAVMSWQWASATTATGSFGDISGATSSAYTPVAGDLGKHLRATVAYTDRHGSGKRAQTVSDNPVIQARVNAAPDFGPGPAARSIPENTPAGRNIGAPVTASDPDPGDSLSYTLGGTDAASFAIVATSGQLQTRAALDYETRNSYTVTVTATDQFDARDTISVTITVTNVDPPGKPGKPTVAAASVGGHNALSVTWTAPAGTAIGGYNVQYRAGVSGSWSGFPRSVSGTAVTIPGLVPSSAYQVRVRAYNSEGTGPWSDPGQGSTDAAPIQQQRLLRQGSGGGVMSPICTPSIGFRTGIPFSFTAARGGGDPPEVLLEVWDRELCGMNFRVSSGAKWLSLSPASGRSEGAHDQRLIRISADISGLGVGTHTAAIRITAPKSGNSPQSVSVSLTITEPAPPESNHCQERTVIESSDGAIRVVVPPGSAPCDMGITVESLGADFRKTLEGRSVDVVRLGKVSAETADSSIDAGLWALLPGDRVSACEEAAAAVYRVDGDSWDPLTHRCEMDEQGRAWTVSPLTGFGVYVVTLPVPSVESGIADEVQLQTPEAAGITISPGTPSPEMTASNGPASSMSAVEAQPTPAPTLDVTHVEVRHTPAPGPDVVYADDSAAGLWADLPPEELAPSVGETGHSPPRRLGSLGIFLYIIAPIIVIIALLLIMFGVRSLRGAESASP